MKNVKSGDHVAVIGGGVIGALSAWNLVEAGCRVTIVDRQTFGAACSHGNCGYVSPSHVFPLCQPGAITNALKTMFRSNSPIRVKPRFSMDFATWFWKFAWQCNRKSMLETGRARHELLQSSKREYQKLIDAESIACEWQEVGLLFVFDHDREFQAYGKVDSLLRREFGVTAKPYAGDELVALEPAIKPGFGGGWHYEGDCHLRPDLLMSQIKNLLLRRGVKIQESFPVDHFAREANQARSIMAGTESIEADHFVVATGAMTPFLNEHLGMKVPIEPGKGYSLTMPKPSVMPKIPIIFEDSHVAITPMQSKYRIGSTMEFVGYDTSINPARVELLRTAAAKYLHEPYCEPVEETWYGWRPMTWDGKPVIDRSPAMQNVWIAAGHNMLGLSMAAGTGRLLKELMFGEPTHIESTPFSAQRFC